MKKLTILNGYCKYLADFGQNPVHRIGCIIETETNKCLHCNWQKYWRHCMADMLISKGAKVKNQTRGGPDG